jgi:hypothetical protein
VLLGRNAAKQPHLFELLGGLRAREMEALKATAAMRGQNLQMLQGLYPFGDDLQAEALADGQQRFHQGGVVGSGRNVADEALVKLQPVHRQTFQVGQGGVANAEVVDQQAKTLSSASATSLSPISAPSVISSARAWGASPTSSSSASNRSTKLRCLNWRGLIFKDR